MTRDVLLRDLATGGLTVVGECQFFDANAQGRRRCCNQQSPAVSPLDGTEAVVEQKVARDSWREHDWTAGRDTSGTVGKRRVHLTKARQRLRRRSLLH
jgi:hypothetical protein